MTRLLAPFTAALLFSFAAAAAPAPTPAPIPVSPLAKSMHDVERLRHLTFLHDVTTAAVMRDTLPQRLRDDLQKSSPYPLEDYGPILKALQLIDPSTKDAVGLLLAMFQQQVLAYYDALSHTYYSVTPMPQVESASAEVLADSVAVHELTHAMQDQRFHLGERDHALENDTDGSLAYHSLIEGEASLVMMAWLMDQSGRTLDDVVKNDVLVNALADAAGQEKTVDPSTPRYFVESLKFPYLEGMSFCIEAYRRGGWKELDRVHADPPRSSREILHPEEYFARRAAKGVAATPFDAKPLIATPDLLDVEHLGEFTLGFLVGKTNALGWVDDRAEVVRNEKGETTVLLYTKWESVARATIFRDAYAALLKKNGLTPRVVASGTSVRVAYGADSALIEKFLPTVQEGAK